MSGAGLSKAAKKNQKKRARKKASKTDGNGINQSDASGELSNADLLSLLKEELENAKLNQDHVLAGKLREQVWVLTDIVAGIKTDMPEEDLIPIISNIQELLGVHQKERHPPPDALPAATIGPTGSERKLRNLRKKLDQIENLKAKEASGEKLEQSQLDKIATQSKLEDEIEELEALIEEAVQLKT